MGIMKWIFLFPSKKGEKNKINEKQEENTAEMKAKN